MYSILVSCAKEACFTVLKDDLLITVNFTREGAWKLRVTYVKSLLCKCDYGCGYFSGGVGDEKLFLRDFKERLRQNFTQDWFSHLSQSTRFEMYHCFKSVIGREEYLDLIKVNIYRTALAPFNVHRLRYSLSEANRACPFCPDKAEDEARSLTASCMETSETCTWNKVSSKYL